MPKMSIAGYELSLQKAKQQTNVSKDRIREGIEFLKKYKAGKENLEAKIVSNEQWAMSRHWELIRGKRADGSDPEPTTAYLFNTLANKHADAMDNYPEGSMLPVEQDDEQEADNLTSIVPVVLEANEYEEKYDLAWWYKLKHGSSVKGIFWNPSLNNGLGDIDVVNLDLLNIYWEPGLKDVQKSPNLFITSLINNDKLKKENPVLPDNFVGSKIVDAKQYVYDDSIDITDKSVVVDWYFKEINEETGEEELHLIKFVDEFPLGSTQDAGIPLYNHGLYPVVFDVLVPEEGYPTGIGYIDIVKNPQMYIDKLDQIISRNALQSGKKRFLYKDNGNVKVEDLLDWSIDAIPCKGNIGEEDFREIQTDPLHPFIVDHRRGKIDELKEISGSNDFTRGESGGGITAASAIYALQEAGNKLSRDMIKGGYRAYKRECYMVIELIRQFYDEDRQFRITGKDNKPQFITYNNKGLQPKLIPPMYEGEEPKYRNPRFDIMVKPQRQSPFSTMANNEMAKEMYTAGFFNPQMAQAALVALEMMAFEGKDTVIEMVQNNAMFMQEMMQLQQQSQMQQQQMMKMAAIIQRLTGQDMGATDTILQQQANQERTLKANGQYPVSQG